MPTPNQNGMEARITHLATQADLNGQYVKEALQRIEAKLDTNTKLTQEVRETFEKRVGKIETDMEWSRRISGGVLAVGSGLLVAFLKQMLHL